VKARGASLSPIEILPRTAITNNEQATLFADVIMRTSLKGYHNITEFLKFDLDIISLKHHNLSKSR